MPTDEAAAVRYIDAADFGANPVSWVVVLGGSGVIVLTVEGIPFAQVKPIGPPLNPAILARSREAVQGHD